MDGSNTLLLRGGLRLADASREETLDGRLGVRRRNMLQGEDLELRLGSVDVRNQSPDFFHVRRSGLHDERIAAVVRHYVDTRAQAEALLPLDSLNALLLRRLADEVREEILDGLLGVCRRNMFQGKDLELRLGDVDVRNQPPDFFHVRRSGLHDERIAAEVRHHVHARAQGAGLLPHGCPNALGLCLADAVRKETLNGGLGVLRGDMLERKDFELRIGDVDLRDQQPDLLHVDWARLDHQRIDSVIKHRDGIHAGAEARTLWLLRRFAPL